MGGFEQALRALAADAAPHLPLPPLEPRRYAQAHERFEARSDQRAALTGWLVDTVKALLPRPTRVLSIGTGDGSVDVEVAAALTAGGPVDYHGVEPHPPSATRFAERLGQLPGVSVSVEHNGFTGTATRHDLVLAVHSLYYVPDLAAALAAATSALAPGGVLLVVHAPLSRLNRLVEVLAPGRRQEFSGVVTDALAAAGTPYWLERIDAQLDLRHPDGRTEEWRDALDFTVQAVLPDALVPSVEAALRAAAADLLLPHPVDAFVVRGSASR